MTDELKPVRCGCGGEAKVYHWNHDPDIEDWYGVRCSECHINISMDKNSGPFWSAKEAVEAWNRAMGKKTAKVIDRRYNGTVLGILADSSYGICENCWGEVLDRYTYCPHCGARLEWK